MEVLPVSYCHDILVFKQQQYRYFNTSQHRHNTDTTNLLFHQPGMPGTPWSLQGSSVRTKLCTKMMQLVPKANSFPIICHRFNEAWQCFAISVSPITVHASIHPHLLSENRFILHQVTAAFKIKLKARFSTHKLSG